MEDERRPLMGGGVKISVSQGSEFLLVGCWSGRMGGSVDPFEGPRLQQNVDFYKNNSIKEFQLVNARMNSK